MAQRPGRRRLRRVPPAEGRYSLAPEQAVALTDEDSPAYLPGFFQIALGSVLDSPRITDAMRSGAGVGWHEHNHDVHDGCERFFRPGYNANLIASWLPALNGVVDRLQRGARVADVGYGHGASTILMAGAYPNSTFIGSDYHAGSIETARRRAREAGVEDRVRFEATPAAAYSGEGYDLVTTFDCLHDMGDPVGAARHVLSTLAPDGTWMIVEPAAAIGSRTASIPSAAPTTGSRPSCTPASLSQDVGLALGAKPGPPGSPTLSPRPASAASAARPRLPSTWSSRCDPDPTRPRAGRGGATVRRAPEDSGYKVVVLNKIGTGPIDQCTVDSVRPGETVTVRCKTGQRTTW